MSLKKLCLVLLFAVSVFPRLQAQTPEIGGEVWIEPGYSEKQIDDFFRIMKENKMTTARMFIMWNQIEVQPGVFDFTPYDHAFRAAEKYGLKVVATLTASEPAPCINKRSYYHLHTHRIIEDEEEFGPAAEYVRQVVTRYKDSPALEYWWLINEPGQWPAASSYAVDRFQDWLQEKYGSIDELNRLWFTAFPDFESIPYSPVWDRIDSWSSNTAYYDWHKFWRDFLTGYLRWVTDEIRKYDTEHPVTVNPHTVFDNMAQYDFFRWREFVDVLGMSIHPSWALTDFRKECYPFGIAGSCDLMKGFRADDNEIWVSEIQGGSNIFSGWAPGCPDKTDIEQWLWTSIGSSAKRILFWCINPRPQGNEAGEWALFGYGNTKSERSEMAMDVAEILEEYSAEFASTKAMPAAVTIITTPESQFMFEARGDSRSFRDRKSNYKSYMAWHMMFTRLGIPVQMIEADDYDWDSPQTGRTVVFPDMISVPSYLKNEICGYVARGNRLIADGLSFQFDEESVNYATVGSPYEELFGARLNDVVFQMNEEVDVPLNYGGITLKASAYLSELTPVTAQPISEKDGKVYATRNRYGDGEAVWIPQVTGVREFENHDADFGQFVLGEVRDIFESTPIVLDNVNTDIMMQTLEFNGGYISVIINCSLNPAKTDLINRTDKKPQIIWGDAASLSNSGKLKMQPRQTLVILWK